LFAAARYQNEQDVLSWTEWLVTYTATVAHPMQ